MSFLLLFLFFVLTSFDFFIQTAEGQINMDSFTARGIIFTQITQSPLLDDDQNVANNTQQQLTSLLNNNNSAGNSIQQDPTKSLPSLQGQWAMEVRKGELDFFRVLFTLIQNQKIVNAFAIYNLTDTSYIQLNDKGSEIISGKVDLTSLGRKNETIQDIDATITISGLTQLRITLDPNVMGKFFNDFIMGSTRFLADGAGNVLVQPKPPAAPRSPSIPSAPVPQSDSLYGSNFLF